MNPGARASPSASTIRVPAADRIRVRIDDPAGGHRDVAAARCRPGAVVDRGAAEQGVDHRAVTSRAGSGRPLEELDPVAVGVGQVDEPAAGVGPGVDVDHARRARPVAERCQPGMRGRHVADDEAQVAAGRIARPRRRRDPVRTAVLEQLDPAGRLARHHEHDHPDVAERQREGLVLVAGVADRVELHLEAEAVAVEGQRSLHVGDRDPAVGEADDLDGRGGHAATLRRGRHASGRAPPRLR